MDLYLSTIRRHYHDMKLACESFRSVELFLYSIYKETSLIISLLEQKKFQNSSHPPNWFREKCFTCYLFGNGGMK